MKPVVLLIMMLSAVGLDATVTKKAETKEAQDKHTTPTSNKEPQTLSRGWGDDLDWCQTYEEGLAKAKEEQKTLMVIHHLEDCPYSQALKKAFTSHPEIQKLAKKFIMLNLVYPPTDKNQAPDGYYVPRIIFVDCFSTVRADIAGRYYNRLYTYEPDDMDILYANMKRALIPYHTEL